jgi:hypothetical protein
MQGGEAGTADERKRDWLFPVILGVLLAGSAISFALAYVGRVIPHQEIKIQSDHGRVSLRSPAADEPYLGVGADGQIAAQMRDFGYVGRAVRP